MQSYLTRPTKRRIKKKNKKETSRERIELSTSRLTVVRANLYIELVTDMIGLNLLKGKLTNCATETTRWRIALMLAILGVRFDNKEEVSTTTPIQELFVVFTCSWGWWYIFNELLKQFGNIFQVFNMFSYCCVGYKNDCIVVVVCSGGLKSAPGLASAVDVQQVPPWLVLYW